MKKRNPIYTAGSFLLAGALTLSMAACSGAQAPAEVTQTPSATATPVAPAEETTPSAAGIRRTPREGFAAQAGRGKPLHGKE